MKHYWRMSFRSVAAFITLGACVSVLIPATILFWDSNRYTVEPSSNYPGISINTSRYVDSNGIGIRARLWFDDESNWPWLDSFPSDKEAVGGVWAGFPLHCVERRVEYAADPPAQGLRMRPSYMSDELYLDPERYRPYWIGLIADTLFWGAVLWCIRGCYRMTLGTRRLRRGRCPACAYDLEGLESGDPCPECGCLIAKSKAQAAAE